MSGFAQFTYPDASIFGEADEVIRQDFLRTCAGGDGVAPRRTSAAFLRAVEAVRARGVLSSEAARETFDQLLRDGWTESITELAATAEALA